MIETARRGWGAECTIRVLGVPRDADERDIKKAYRKLSKVFHPDKASAQGITPEEAQKKMAAINEAYEILSDPELKQRFDNGDDPVSTALEWGVRQLAKPVTVHAEGDIPAAALADLFPAYDEDGGLLVVLTPQKAK